METRKIISKNGIELGEVTLPDGKTEEEWTAVLSCYLDETEPETPPIPSINERLAALEQNVTNVLNSLSISPIEIQ